MVSCRANGKDFLLMRPGVIPVQLPEALYLAMTEAGVQANDFDAWITNAVEKHLEETTKQLTVSRLSAGSLQLVR